ncbi:hypothetical protein CQW23_32332 [Capsicum baccatum]|uniref:Uncharacterized protein n=1 Tax=Capsicum baccatum TaxID=33114 RepID=A0A2G2V546_CAPBA|nr:hypothetical protein CQW23_32332 [Capsicum baccatum]
MSIIPVKARQDGVAERIKITLNKRGRIMRIHYGMPKMFWADAREKGSREYKASDVELELSKSKPKNIMAETQQTPETIVKELEVEPVIHEKVLRRSSRTIRAPDMYSPSLHYLLLIDERELESVTKALVVEEGVMCLEKIKGGAKNPADMLTKCVDVGKLRLCKTLVGLL